MANKYIIGILVLVVLTASIYVLLPENVRIDVGKTYSTFKVWEDGSWVLAGKEYTLMFDGTTKMRAWSRTVEHFVEGEIIRIVRTANFKNNVTVIDTYTFDGDQEDIKLFPISHDINVLNGEGYILVYEVTKLDYSGETINDILSPQEFGHNMRIEWEGGNYYSRIWGYANEDEGKLTVKYRPDSTNFTKQVRLFDPPVGEGDIGYELLDNNKVLHIWNTENDYYFNATSGIQFTNWYEEYWTKNIFCVGYKTTEWHYNCNDEVNFNWNIESDDTTFVNVTGYKDITFSGKTIRAVLRYHLKVNDTELNVIPAIINLGDAIDVDIGFAWRMKDIKINNTEENDSLYINNTVYSLNEDLDLTFTDMIKLIQHFNYSYYVNQDCYDGCVNINSTPSGECKIICNRTNATNDYNYTIKIPSYAIIDKARIDLRWNENLNYWIKVKSIAGQFNAPVTLGINAGSLAAGQAKSTIIYWSDNPGVGDIILQDDGNISINGTTTSDGMDLISAGWSNYTSYISGKYEDGEGYNSTRGMEFLAGSSKNNMYTDATYNYDEVTVVAHMRCQHDTIQLYQITGFFSSFGSGQPYEQHGIYASEYFTNTTHYMVGTGYTTGSATSVLLNTTWHKFLLVSNATGLFAYEDNLSNMIGFYTFDNSDNSWRNGTSLLSYHNSGGMDIDNIYLCEGAVDCSIAVAPPEDTCTCAGAGNNWEVDMEDNCNLTTACTLTTGNLSWIGSSGYFNCSEQLNLTNRNAPPSATIFYHSSGCEVNRI